MAVDFPEINGTARPAAWTEHVKPGHACDQCCPDRRRPQHVAAGGLLLIPALDDRVGNLPLGIDRNVEVAGLSGFLIFSQSRDGPDR